MKKILKVFLITILLNMTTGCVKYKVEMSIKQTKELDVSLTAAISKEILSLIGEKSILEDDERKKFEDLGYVISEYDEDGYVGHIITRKIKNIDSVSSENASSVDLGQIFEVDAKVIYYFKLEKGFFKNKYTAKFISKSLQDEIGENVLNDNSINNDANQDIQDELNKIAQNMEVSFKLNLPMKAISSNADVKSKNGKTLTWNLIDNNKNESIEFEFEIINLGSTLSVGSGIVALILLIISNLAQPAKKEKELQFTNDEKIDVNNFENVNLETMESPSILETNISENNGI